MMMMILIIYLEEDVNFVRSAQEWKIATRFQLRPFRIGITFVHLVFDRLGQGTFIVNLIQQSIYN